jgi:hypothetical protein
VPCSRAGRKVCGARSVIHSWLRKEIVGRRNRRHDRDRISRRPCQICCGAIESTIPGSSPDTLYGLTRLIEGSGLKVEAAKKLTTGPRCAVFLVERQLHWLRFGAAGTYGKLLSAGVKAGEAAWPTYALPAIVWWILKNRLTICT